MTDVPILACRPAHPPVGDPALRRVYDQLEPLEPGFEERRCARCGDDILIGVRQLAYEKDHPDVPVVCMLCAVIAGYRMGGDTVIKNLGRP